MDKQKDLLVVDRLGIVKTDTEEEYLAHLLCLGGTCRYQFNGKEFELHAGDPFYHPQAKNDRKNRTEGRFPM